jgi:tetratricopeptide (TPR) repeat protein
MKRTLLLSVLLLISLPAHLRAEKHPVLDSLERAQARQQGADKVLTLIQLGYFYSANTYVNINPEKAREFYIKAASLSDKRGMERSLAECRQRIGYTYFLEQNFDSALFHDRAALDLSSKINDTVEIIMSLGLLGDIQMNINEFDAALKNGRKAYELAKLVKRNGLIDYTLHLLIEFYNRLGISQKEEGYLHENIKFALDQNANPAVHYSLLGRFYVFHARYPEAIKYFILADSAFGCLPVLEKIREKPIGFWRAKQMGDIARAYRFWGYNDSALTYHRKALQCFAVCGISEQNVDVANQLEGIGLIYTARGKYDTARSYFERSIKIRQEQSDWLGVGACHDGLGQISWLLGNYEEAIKHLSDALEYKTNAVSVINNPRMVSYKESSSNTHLLFGKVYAEWGIHEASFREFNSALDLCKQIGFISGQTEALIEIGKLHLKTGDFTLSQEKFSEAMTLCTRAGDRPGQAAVLKNEGDLFFLKMVYGKALDCYLKSIQLSGESVNPAEHAELGIRTGKTQGLLCRYREGEKSLSEAISEAEVFGLAKIRMEGHFALSELLERSGRITEALRHYERGLNLKKELFQRKTNYILSDINARFQSEQKESQILLLSKDTQLSELKMNRLKAGVMGLMGLILLTILFFIILNVFIRMKSEHRSALLRLRVLRTQLNPNMIYRALTDIGDYVRKFDTDTAQAYLSHFSRFLQTILHGSRQEFIELEQEMLLVSSYLNLQLLFHPGKFEFDVTSTELHAETGIPPFLTFPFIEDAACRMAGRKETGGKLLVSYGRDKKILVVTIEHNGDVSEADPENEQLLQSEVDLIRQRLEFIGKKIMRKRDVEQIIERRILDQSGMNRVRIRIPLTDA